MQSHLRDLPPPPSLAMLCQRTDLRRGGQGEPTMLGGRGGTSGHFLRLFPGKKGLDKGVSRSRGW